MPVTDSVATLTMPSVENRRVASRASDAHAARDRAGRGRAAARAAPGRRSRLPRRRDAVRRLPDADCRVRPASSRHGRSRRWPRSGPAPPPARASAPAPSRSNARQTARMIASARRISDTNPNCVSFNTVGSTFDVMASPSGRPLIETACNRSQSATRDNARRRARSRPSGESATGQPLLPLARRRKAGSATSRGKPGLPAVIAVAAKCTARTAINGPSIPAPNQIHRCRAY